MSQSIVINQQEYPLDVPMDMPLLWFLRDKLELTGTIFGCGMGLCGACTIHVDGTATRSCVLPVSAVAGKSITTIEGLSEEGDHPLQEAWLEHKVPQCGYCQAGQIMNAASFLATNKTPSGDDIDNAMQGNICRCGTYQRIKAAITDAAEVMYKEVK
jgi:aerobic-type carbon monoxide dehydrogenase small subunit (CoxS/CutS family)